MISTYTLRVEEERKKENDIRMSSGRALNQKYGVIGFDQFKEIREEWVFSE